MSDQFFSPTGLPVMDFFLNGYAKALDMHRALTPRIALNGVRPQQALEIATGATEEQVIPIMKEELRIGKRQVQNAKAYRISATVVEVPVEQQVNLRAETVVIERRPTTGTTVRGGQSFEDRTIEIHEMYEEPVIGKVVTQAEEVVVYKTLSERTAVVRESVRETRVNVEEHATKDQAHLERNGAESDGGTRNAGGNEPRALIGARASADRHGANKNSRTKRHRG